MGHGALAHDHAHDKARKAARAALERLRDSLNALVGCRAASDLTSIDRILAPTLAVAGENGAGKSTLVNAIFGLPLAPTDANAPAAAPIVIDADDSAPPSYVVERSGTEGGVRCADRDAFAGFLYRGENLGNATGLIQGLIRAAGPHLAGGFRLFELPDLEGAPEPVQQAVAALLHSAGRAILVINDRNAAPGLRIASRLKGLGRGVDALIINLRSSKLLEDETREPLAYEVAAENIAAVRSFVCEQLKKTGFEIPPGNVFAIYLPAMRGLKLVKNAGMNAPAHADEAQRFAAWFRAAYGAETDGARFAQALKTADALVDEERLAGERAIALLAGLRRCDQSSVAQAEAALDRHRARLSNKWSEALLRAGEEAAAERAVAVLADAVQRLKNRLADLHQGSRASLPDDKWKWDVADRDRIAAALSRETAAAAAEFERCREREIEAYLDVCEKAAEAVGADDDDGLKFLQVAVDAAPVAPRPLWQAPHFEVAAPGFLGLDWLWSLSSIDGMLRRIFHAEMILDPTAEGPFAGRFQTQLADCREAQFARLRRRLDAIAAIIADPDHPALIAARRAAERRSGLLDEARGAAAALRKALDALDRAGDEGLN
jgi:hypothetical protein